MSLPPERVNIKRKRDAEAVDVLFLQDKKRARTRFIFQKVDPGSNRNLFAPTPKIQDVKPQGATAATTPAVVSSRPAASPHDPKQPSKRNEPAKRVGLRQFRLDRPSEGRIQKTGNTHGRSRSPKKTFATFLETRDSLSAKAAQAAAEKVDASPQKKTHLTVHKRIRPRTSAADLAWREKTRASTAGSRSASQAPAPDAEDPEQLKLAESLSAFALEATKPAPSLVAPFAAKNPLKFQPKPAVSRRGQNTDNTENHDTDMSDNESDYEYDTYIRVPVTADPIAMDIDMDARSHDPAFLGKSLGVLVIEDEDEELWAMYALDEDDEKEFETDEDDENAEDFYGNDYPEDELDSDDEFNRGAYGYRYADSDDEQCSRPGSDDGASSDGEARLSRVIGTQSAHSWANEFTSPVQNQGLDPY